MCVSKLLKRIVNPEMSDDELAKMKDTKKLNQHLHMYTHGINSDPMTLFAILFSAIIHDVDHPGVSNKQFSAEHPLLGEKYHNKSVAEQNSLDVAWDVLMDSHFREMREYIFETNEELSRFRQIVVNVVRIFQCNQSACCRLFGIPHARLLRVPSQRSLRLISLTPS